MERGPGLYKDMTSFVVAKDTKNKKLLLGGLGGMGMGEMWVNLCDGDENRSGFAEAPEVDFKK